MKLSGFLLVAAVIPPHSKAFQPTSRWVQNKRVDFSAESFAHTSLRVSTLEDEEQGIIDVEFKKESARLSKAKQLLSQYMVEKEPETSNFPTNGSNATSTIHGKTRRPSSGTKKFAPLAIQGVANIPGEDSSTIDTSSNVVPDQYWSNGHLQGGNYVTRWASGVKVAEPLIKYDPVAAEKLLFRQPAKWLVRNTQIAFPMGWWAAGVVTDYMVGRSKQNRRQRAEQLLNAITNLGPAIIKGGAC